MIPAVILLADLADFTLFSNACATDQVIARLNRFFGAMDDAIVENGGEVLKLIGDGLLGIFPTPDDPTAQAAAAAGALSALEEARGALSDPGGAEPIAFRAALHIGEIFYGNIGSRTRLDFTAVGPAVNLAARLLAEAGALETDTVCSEDFLSIAALEARPLGEIALKGFDVAEPIYGLASGRDISGD